jgi:hypothetical protein
MLMTMRTAFIAGSSLAAVVSRGLRIIGWKPRGVGTAFLYVGSAWHQARESRDSPRLKAFWRVAPSVRFSVRAKLAARVFLLAAVFNVRTSAVDHGRRFDFLGI